ncbi:hypothetical protein HY489_02985 [Candidatus Woesearchaeota archaeon]|nr:hypothetical protein [Candidatus Woesearchaeota archaeon]
MKAPDVAKARSLVQASEREMQYLLELKPTAEGASTIVSRIYECFHQLGQALLAMEGKVENHEDRLKAVIGLQVTADRPLQALDWLRTVRQNINYNGYQASLMDLDEAIALVKTFWKLILGETKKRVSQ